MKVTDLLNASFEIPSVIYLGWAFTSTLSLLAIAYVHIKRRKEYLNYKETWSIGVYKWEKQADQDKMMIQLWDENQALKKQVKKYKGKFTKVGWAVISMLFKLLEENKGNKHIKKRLELMNVQSVQIEGKRMTINFKRELSQLENDEITNLPTLD